MGKINFRIKLLFIAIVVMFIAVMPVNVFAIGSYSASLGSSSINVGSSTNVNIKTVRAAGKFTVTSSNSAVARVSTALTWVDDGMDPVIRVTGVKAGTATITITPTNVSDDEYNLLTGSRSISITVKEPTAQPIAVKSSDSTLSSLTTNIGEIGFKASTTSYTVNVDKTVTSLGIKAIANNSKATVKITGDENFAVGENVVKITVTAENGNVTVYEIKVVKSKYKSGPLLKLEIEGFDMIPEFDPGEHNYTVDVVGISLANVKYELENETSTVTIEGNKGLVIGRNKVKVIVTENNGTITEYNISVNLLKSATDIIEKNNITWIIVIVILAMLLIAETVYIILKKRKKETNR